MRVTRSRNCCVPDSNASRASVSGRNCFQTSDEPASLLADSDCWIARREAQGWWCKSEDDRKNTLSLPHMYRSSRSVTRTVFPSRLLHSSPLCLNTTKSQPTPSKPKEPSERADGPRSDGEPALSERLRGATSLLRGYITKATGDTAIGIRKRADGFTAVTQVLFSELGGQLNRATGYEEIEQLKKKVEEQGMCSLTHSFFSVNLPSKICIDQSPG